MKTRIISHINLALDHPVFGTIADTIAEMNVSCYVIGGFVRDLLLGRPSKDIDLVVVGSGIDLARAVAKKLGRKGKITVYRNFGTALLKIDDLDVEFVGARKESYRSDSRNPLVEDGSLEDDQNRRDFTINTMSISLNRESYGELFDPFNGMSDLENRIIRTPLDPDITYSDDPLRMLRAIRFATQLGFEIEERSLIAIRHNRDRITIISKERIIDEINKMVMSAKPSVGFLLMEQCGLLELIFPELDRMKGVSVMEKQGHKDNFRHTMLVLDKISLSTDNLWLRWAAIMHDIAKPATRKFIKDRGWTFHGHEFLGAKWVPVIFRRLHLPLGASMKYVQKLVLLHLRPIALVEEEVTDSAVRRLLFEAGDDIEDLMMLCEADITSKNDVKVKEYLANFQVVRNKLREIEEKDAVRNFQPPVDGALIMKTFNIGPCREVGIIKSAIKDAILDGTIHNDFDEAFGLMMKKGEELGLKKGTSDQGSRTGDE
jgi:poly(A) polymerase